MAMPWLEMRDWKLAVIFFSRIKNAPQFPAGRFVFSEFLQGPTLASSSLFSTFTILNCSACMPAAKLRRK